MLFRIAGEDVELTAESVRRAVRGAAPESVQTHSVVVDGVHFPVVQALELATGISRSRTRSARARDVLGRLGLELRDADIPAADRALKPLPPASPAPEERPAVSRSSDGSLWALMRSQGDIDVAAFSPATVPAEPGVYAFFRGDDAVYVGRAVTAGGLRSRLRTHTATGVDLSHSSFRRNVAEHLGVAPTSVTRIRPPRLTASDVEPVNDWIRGCTVRWLTAPSVEAAKALEDDMKREWRPPLTKR